MRSIPEPPGTPRARVSGEAGFTLVEMLVAIVLSLFVLGTVLVVFQTTQRSVFRTTAAEGSLVQARAVVDKFGGDFRMVGAARISFAAPILDAGATRITFEGDIDNTLATDNNPVRLAAAVAPNAASITVTDATNIVCGTRITLADGPIAENHLLPANCKAGNTITFGPDPCPTGGAAGDRPCIDYPAGSFVYTVESVNWRWDQSSGRLCRKVNAACPTSASTWNDDTDVIASGVTGFTLSYLDRNGATIALDGSGTLPSNRYLDVRSVTIALTVRTQSGEQRVQHTMDLSARARNIVP